MDVAPRTMVPGRHLRRLGAVGAPTRTARCALSRRQLGPRTDGALRVEADQRGPPPADELVPVSRPRVAAVLALPEPPLHDGWAHRHRCRSRHGLSLVPLPAARTVAADRLLEWPALPAFTLGGRVRGCGRAVPRLGGRHRVRDQGLCLGRLRRVDPTVGLVDASLGLGLHLQGTFLAAPARRLARRLLHHGDGRVALRDGLPRARAPHRVAVPGALGHVAPARARHRRGRGRALGVSLGHLARDRPVALGCTQPGPRRHATRERLRRATDAVLADPRPAL